LFLTRTLFSIFNHISFDHLICIRNFLDRVADNLVDQSTKRHPTPSRYSLKKKNSSKIFRWLLDLNNDEIGRVTGQSMWQYKEKQKEDPGRTRRQDHGGFTKKNMFSFI
jgi:hypothetical protein